MIVMKPRIDCRGMTSCTQVLRYIYFWLIIRTLHLSDEVDPMKLYIAPIPKKENVAPELKRLLPEAVNIHVPTRKSSGVSHG